MEAAQTPPPTVSDLLAKAIRRRSVVSLSYDGGETMLLEPIVLGIFKETGQIVLRCYKSYPIQLKDKKENWYLLELGKISNLKLTPVRAKSHRDGCKVLEGDMAQVLETSSDYIKG
jgi:hypothetical protein